ncbi:MAG: hypothetical protein NTV21_18150 [Planctomycetota bacterium]|nr:hypothetical protein [Planctomycetota bacterium]
MHRLPVRLAALSVALASLVASCAAPQAGARELRFGTLREVMREGRSEGRVALAEVPGLRATVGVGALAGLAGEVTVVEGELWIARAVSGRVEVAREPLPGEQATLLALSGNVRWVEHLTPRDLTLEEFGIWLGELGPTADASWPFLAEGTLDALEAHVVAGACPHAHPGATDSFVVLARPSLAVRLAGFHAPAEPGVLVHHGERLHVHFVESAPVPSLSGHLDGGTLRAGARVRIPAR